jgi:two-component system response regulator RegA
MTFNTLILEDDIGLRKVLVSEFNDFGHVVFEADEIINIPRKKYDFAVLDLRVKGESSLMVVPQLLNDNLLCKIVILTGFGSIATAIDAMKLGAFNYLTKPASFDQILMSLELKSNIGGIHSSPEIEANKRISLSQNEYEYINFVLNQNHGNISKTAKDLGLHRQSLQRKLKKLP